MTKLTTRRGNTVPSKLRASIALMAISSIAGGLSAMPAVAQSEDNALEEVLVTGISGALQRNLDVKRDAAAFVDAITAEDIGKFPDKNVADALQRVPGVSITRDGGEGQFVSVRGVSPELTLTLLNGNYVATAVNSRDPVRSFNYALLPSTLISSVEVYKTPEARLDEGGIGGTVIINTRKPLDMDANSGYLNVEGTYADVTGKTEGQVGGLYSWKNDDETFGILASVTQQDRTATSEYVRTESWFYWGQTTLGDFLGGVCPVQETCFASFESVDGDPIIGYGPGAIVVGQKTEIRDNLGYQVTMQWEPSEQFSATFNYIGATLSQNNETIEENGYLNDFYTSNPFWQAFGFGPSMITDYRIENDTIVMLEMTDPDGLGGQNLSAFAAGGFIFDMDSQSDTYDLELEFSGDKWSSRVNIGQTESDGGVNRGVYQRYKGAGGATSTWKYDLNAPKILTGTVSEYNAIDWNQPDFGGTHTDEETYAQVDFHLDTQLGLFNSFDLGGKWRDHTVRRVNSNTYWDDGDLCNENRWGYDPCILGQHWFHTVQNDPDPSVVNSWVQRGDSLTGNLPTGTQGLVGIDWKAYEDWIESTWTPVVKTNGARVFRIEEEITALYAQGNFELGAISGNLGLRYVSTDQSSTTFNCLNFVCDDTTFTESGSTSDLLPSLNVKWDASEDLVVRASAAEVISRVGYADLGGALVWYAGIGAVTGYGTQGNTDLEPYRANQFDVALEWYFEEGAIAGATFFYKDIKTFITKNTESVELTAGNSDYLVSLTTPVNGNDATSKGVEVYLQKGFSWGGGVTANYTYTDTGLAEVNIDGSVITTPLPGASKNQANVSAYYETDKWSARVSYNWRGRWAKQPYQGNTWYTDEYDQIDVNGSYSINDQLTANFAVINLTEESIREYWGVRERFIDDRYSGRRVYVGLNYSF
jgi:iron complex outermembrane receptor protein